MTPGQQQALIHPSFIYKLLSWSPVNPQWSLDCTTLYFHSTNFLLLHCCIVSHCVCYYFLQIEVSSSWFWLCTAGWKIITTLKTTSNLSATIFSGSCRFSCTSCLVVYLGMQFIQPGTERGCPGQEKLLFPFCCLLLLVETRKMRDTAGGWLCVISRPGRFG